MMLLQRNGYLSQFIDQFHVLAIVNWCDNHIDTIVLCQTLLQG